MPVDERPIVVTGAAGFIGSHLVEALLARGDAVVGIDNFDPYYDKSVKMGNLGACRAHPRADRFRFVEADIREPDQIDQVLRQWSPRGVIHLAAKAGVRPSIADPVGYARTNVVGTSVMLEAARAAACDRIVLASSSSVYGNNKVVPFSEEHEVGAPISPYAATKRCCELIARTHHHLTGMPTACLRFFTVFGPRQRPDLAISLFMRKIAAGEPVPMFGDGSMSRDYTYIDDIVAGVIASYDRIDRHGYRIWNLGGHHPVVLTEMIETIARVVGKEAVVNRLPTPPGDVERTYADLTRSGRELGFSPATPFAEGVARQWAWLKDRPQRTG